MKTNAYHDAENAIRNFAADTRVSPEQTIDGLEELKDLIDEISAAIQADLDASGKGSGAL